MKRRPSKGTKPRKQIDPESDPRYEGLRLKFEKLYGARAQYIPHARGVPKLSVAIASFVSPYEIPDETLEQFRSRVALGCAVWNVSLQPPDERRKMIRQMLKAVPRSQRELIAEVIDELLLRKLTDFADDRRLIAEFDASQKEDGSFFLAAAALTTMDGELLHPADD
jgi:hypothetical protein